MAQPSHDRISTTPHEVHRLSIEVGTSFQDFCVRYEEAVPKFDAGRFELLIRDAASWETILQVTAETAPHDFLIYWTAILRQ
jgi:hypothetical protein